MGFFVLLDGEFCRFVKKCLRNLFVKFSAGMSDEKLQDNFKDNFSAKMSH